MKITNRFILIAFLFIIPIILHGQNFEKEIQNSKLLKESTEFANNGDYDHAILILRKLITIESNMTLIAMCYNNIGSYQKIQKKYNDAISTYSLAIETAPAVIMSYVNRGSLYVKMKDNDKALNDYARALKIDSTDENTLMARSIVYSNIGELKLAETDLELLNKYHPKSPFGTINLASLYKKEGKFSKALQIYDHQIKRESNNAYLFNNRAEILMIMNNLVEALKSVNSAILIKPKFGYAYFMKAKILIKMNNLENACNALNSAILYGYSGKELTNLMKSTCESQH